MEGKFKHIATHLIDDLAKKKINISESDLCLQSDTHIIQYKFEKEEQDREKYKIKPGVFNLEATNNGLILGKLDLVVHDLLDSATNNQLIKNEADKLFKRLDVFKRLRPNNIKRSILLYSQPGLGKSSSIAKMSAELVAEDKGTVVIFWDTSSIRAGDVSAFFSSKSEFTKDCTRLLFIMEDIGGGNVESYGGPRSADASLLELLDGASSKFRIPTFIIATTNTPENLLKSLADRPGRFDEMFELEAPGPDERVALLTHIAKRELTEEETEAGRSKEANGLSIAHLSEIVIRSELADKSFAEVISDMKNHKKKLEKAFSKVTKNMGLI